MMIRATLSNPKDKNCPPVSICFPIKDCAEIYSKLRAIGIGSAIERDCFVSEINSDYCPILKRLEQIVVNVDELDYLAKRLDSFDKHEIAKFQGMTVIRGYDDITDLINLTFCCQASTVIQDFTDLTAVGREHYMDIHGGVTEEELKMIDFRMTALSLILNEVGNITPYGVIYENEVCLEQIYDGQHFPDYDYDSESVMVVAMSDRNEPGESASVTWLYLPMQAYQIERAMLRAGIYTYNDMLLQVERSKLFPQIDNLISAGNLSLNHLNELCIDYKDLDQWNMKKFEAVLQVTEPSSISEVSNLIKQLDLFEFIPGVLTPEEYGRHMIKESGHFQYDGELDEFYDFKKYGNRRIENEQGQFTSNGYVSYHGFLSIKEVMTGSQTECMEMGGMQLK